MKLIVQHFDIRSTPRVDQLIEERIFDLQPHLQIEEAIVHLEHHPETSPPFRVQVRLVTPGRDVTGEGRGYTIQAAIDQVMAELEDHVVGRWLKRIRRTRSNLQSPAALRVPRALKPRPAA